jgi:agmatine deiminase
VETFRSKSGHAGKEISPRELGYRMPAEWEPHEATWLAWPHNLETWSDQLELVKQIWVEMIRAIAVGENVCLLVNDQGSQAEAEKRLMAVRTVMERVSIYQIPTVDVWIRDYGPTFLTRKGTERGLAFNDWIFNAWGKKYESYARDDRIATEISKLLHVPVFEVGIVLEGGSIDVNGRGACLTTEQCLLNTNRNPRLQRSEIEQILGNYLNVDRIIWLGAGIVGDDTDGHIDDIARFVNPYTVVCSVEKDSRDENYIPLRENFERLQSAEDQDGHKLTVIPLPSPGRVVHEGTRLPASYANFYIANGVVLVPIYNHSNDELALGILAELFPDRKVIGIPCAPLVVGLGAIHCVTQQQPSP